MPGCNKCKKEEYLHMVFIDGFSRFTFWVCEECKSKFEELVNDWLAED